MSNSDGAILEELIDTDDTVDSIDAERVNVTSGGTNCLGTRNGEYWLGRSESVDAVGVSSEDGGEGTVGGDSGLAAVICDGGLTSVTYDGGLTAVTCDNGLAAVTCVIGTESETEDGVEGSILGEDGLTSDIVGVGNNDDSDVSGALLGRKPDVSKELSGSSGIACDAIDGEARSMEDS